MANLHGFNANNVDPAVDFEPIPAGKYLAVITGSEMKATKNGSGSFLELTFQVIEGPYRNRQLWARLNLDNPNKQAVEIARAQLSAICRAVGVMQPKDSLELHNLPLQITVKCKRREDTDEIVNEIRAYTKKEAAAGQPQQEISNTPPWARK
ncbi:MAG: hypothetical protein OHK0028_19110 [Deltaproteobacteria bacterium]